MVEHWTFNPQALGSNPIAPNFNFKITKMFYQLSISTKNSNTLKNFLILLKTIKKKPYLNELKIIESHKKRKSKYLTLLKSPHINKTAREQVGFNVYTKIVFVRTNEIELFSLILKQLKHNLFFDLSFKLTFFKHIYM